MTLKTEIHALKSQVNALKNNMHDLLVIKRLLKIDYTNIQAYYEFRFYDVELTEINWANLKKS